MTTLAPVYNALIEAKVKPESATAAMAALEETRDEPWKRGVDANFARLNALVVANLALTMALIGIVLLVK